MVPATNSQKLSASRLNYKAFGRSQASPFEKEIGKMSESLPATASEPVWARSRPSTGPTRRTSGDWRQPAPKSMSKGNGRIPQKRWKLGLQICSSVLVADLSLSVWSSRVELWFTCSPSTRIWCCSRYTPPRPRSPGNFLSLRSQGRSERHGIPAGSAVAPRTPAPTATRYGRNSPVAFPGRGAPANRR